MSLIIEPWKLPLGIRLTNWSLRFGSSSFLGLDVNCLWDFVFGLGPFGAGQEFVLVLPPWQHLPSARTCVRVQFVIVALTLSSQVIAWSKRLVACSPDRS